MDYTPPSGRLPKRALLVYVLKNSKSQFHLFFFTKTFVLWFATLHPRPRDFFSIVVDTPAGASRLRALNRLVWSIWVAFWYKNSILWFAVPSKSKAPCLLAHGLWCCYRDQDRYWHVQQHTKFIMSWFGLLYDTKLANQWSTITYNQLFLYHDLN